MHIAYKDENLMLNIAIYLLKISNLYNVALSISHYAQLNILPSIQKYNSRYYRLCECFFSSLEIATHSQRNVHAYMYSVYRLLLLYTIPAMLVNSPCKSQIGLAIREIIHHSYISHYGHSKLYLSHNKADKRMQAGG